MSLKLEKISLLLIIRLFSVWHDGANDATRMQLQAMMPAAAVDHLRPFRRNRFFLWTYWHRPVARFRWRQRGRQSEKWAWRMQFWARIDGDFAALMGAVGSGGQIWRCHRREDALTCVVVEGRRGRRERRGKGDQKSV
jgi:hypothetical protein